MANLMAVIAAATGAKIPVEQFMPIWRPVAEMTPQEMGDMYAAAIEAYRAGHPDEVVE